MSSEKRFLSKCLIVKFYCSHCIVSIICKYGECIMTKEINNNEIFIEDC